MKENINQFLYKTFYQLDLFMVNPNLRYRGKPYTSSVCLGVLSFLIMMVFAGLLVSNLKLTYQRSDEKVSFIGSVAFGKQPKPFQNLMIAFSFQQLDQKFQSMVRYYTFIVTYKNSQNQQITEVLKVCHQQQWSQLGQNYKQIFLKYQLDVFFCFPTFLNLNSTKPYQSFLTVKLIYCNNDIVPNCASQNETYEHFKKVVQKFQSFPIYVYQLTQNVNVQEQDPIQYSIHKFQYQLSFNFSAIIDQFYQSVQINTVQNYLSILDDSSKIFSYDLTQTRAMPINIKHKSGQRIFQYNAIYSPMYYSYQRKYDSIDDIFSYVGGLFGIIVMFLSFVLIRYDQLKYQLNVAESSFNFNSDGKKVKSKDLNALSYIKYLFFVLLNYIFNKKPQMKRTKQMVQTIEQSTNVLDIKKLFKRFEFIERIVWKQNNQNYLKCMTIQEVPSIDQIRSKRNILGYYQKIIDLKQAASVQDALGQNPRQSFKYLDKLEQKKPKRSSLMMKITQQNICKGQKNIHIIEEIQQSFVKNLGFSRYTSKCISKYPKIAEQAKKVKLRQQSQEVEKLITDEFMKFSQQQKENLIKKMPIVILHRLRLRAEYINSNSTPNQKKSIKTQKIGLVTKKQKSTYRKIRRYIINFFWALDLFSAKPNLRLFSKPHKGTIWFGMISLPILAFFIYLFFQGVVRMSNLDSRVLQVTQLQSLNFELKQVSNLMYAVKFVTKDNFETYIQDPKLNLFHYVTPLFYILNNQTKVKTNIKASICTVDKWSALQQNYEKQFTNLGLQTAICLQKPINVSLINDIDDFFLYIEFKLCSAEYCTNKSLQYFNKIVKRYKNFPIQIYYLVSQVQTDNIKPFHYRIQRIKLVSTQHSHSKVTHLFYTVQIQTDRSMVSFSSSISSQKRTIGHKFQYNYIEDTLINNQLFIFICKTTPKQIKYARKTDTIDDLFSYLGGLFGFIVLFFAWWLGSYNQYRYQLGVAENCFSFNTDGKKISESYLNAWTYIKFSLFDWINTVFCYEPKWKRTGQMNETRQEALSMLDPQNLFRRLQFLEDTIWKTTDKRLIMSMTLIQQDTLQNSKKNRLILDYYNEVVELKNAATVEDAIQNRQISFEYLKEVQQNILRETKQNSEQNSSNCYFDRQKYNNDQIAQLKNSMSMDLGIRPQICQYIARYPIIRQQAKRVMLRQQLWQIEQSMAKSFRGLDQKVKQNLIKKIPILILHRLHFKIMQLKSQTNSKESYREFQNNINKCNKMQMQDEILKQYIGIQIDLFGTANYSLEKQ